MRTPYGEPSGALTFGEFAGAEVVFLARHGYGHTLSPHEINYRANIWALKELKVEGVIAVATVGGIRADLAPGTLVLPDQIIDYTHSRKSTFFEGSEMPVTHVDFTQPYSRALRERLIAAAAACNEKVFDGAVYACTQGPRLETAAEIERIAREGGDVVGMTGHARGGAGARGRPRLRIARGGDQPRGRPRRQRAGDQARRAGRSDAPKYRARRAHPELVLREGHRDSRRFFGWAIRGCWKVSQPVQDLAAPELKTLVDDMFETMHAASGAGLAAPQIGVPLRLVIFGYSDPEARNPRYPMRIRAANDFDQSGDRAGRQRNGRGLGRVLVGARLARRRSASLEDPLPRRRSAGTADRSCRRRFSCPCCAARMRSPRRHSLSDARARFSRFGYTDILFPEMADADD